MKNQRNTTTSYATAQIAPPASAGKLTGGTRSPTKPYRLTATLDAAGGKLELRWKARQPAGTSGTTYLVRRRLPAGVAKAQYTIEARRGEKTSGVSAILLVNFGRVAMADESLARTGAGRSRAMPTAPADG